jgi:general secretion pathway protein G
MPIQNPESQIPNLPHPPRLGASAGNPSRFVFSAFPLSAFSSSAIRPQSSVLGRFAAFTLIELLVVVTIIAILAGLVIATVGGVQKSSYRNKAQAEVEALSRAIENYKLEIGSYPPQNPATALYNELTGNGTINTKKVYFEPPRGMATNAAFVDPWGMPYKYEVDKPVNIGLFDLFSTAGQTDTNLFIRN